MRSLYPTNLLANCWGIASSNLYSTVNQTSPIATATGQSLDGQQRLTTLFMVLLSGQPVVIKDQKSQKLIKKWYYLDIEKCLDPDSDRREAILALPEAKKLPKAHGVIDVSTPCREYLVGLFPLSKVFSFSEWRSKYSKFWDYDPEKLKLLDTLELEVLKKFEHYQMPVIQLRDSLPKEAVCQVFEDTNTSGCDLNFFDLMTASYCIDPKYYNCIVNRTGLCASTNKKIGSKPPSVYLKQFEREGVTPNKLDDMLR